MELANASAEQKLSNSYQSIRRRLCWNTIYGRSRTISGREKERKRKKGKEIERILQAAAERKMTIDPNDESIETDDPISQLKAKKHNRANCMG